MQFLGVALLIVTVIVFVWVSHTRNARRRWISELDLIGTWERDQSEREGPDCSIRFTGDSPAGEFCESINEQSIEGTWKLERSSLILSDDAFGDREYEVRLFEHGKIGLNGHNRDHEVFVKRSENIVQLRRRS